MFYSNPLISRLIVLAFCSVASLSFNTASVMSDDLVDDDFSAATYQPRNAARGEWKIEDSMASVEQDDALYKKYKNHGPIMIYNAAHDDATAVVEFKPTGCKTVVFTMDATDGGHAFRVKMWTAPKEGVKGKKERKSTAITYLAKIGDAKAELVELNNEIPNLIDGQWHRLEVSVKGDKATVKIGDKTIHVQHPQIDQKKKVAKIGFSFGGMAIRKFQLSQ